jgi:hypothetical protein
MMDESWQDTIQPLLAAPSDELTIEFGVRFVHKREDELESHWRLPYQRVNSE